MKSLFLVVFVAMMPGCAGIRKTVNYDPTAGFREYERYEWASDAAGLEESPEHLEIRAEFDGYLQEGGYERVTANPDFLVNILLGPEGIDFSAAYKSLRYRPSRNLPINLDGRSYPADALVFDVIDRDSRELVWRGVATRVFDAATGRFVRMRLGVEVIMRDFPPG
jgi:Domain of unknown function (DUF4136)